ncbi:MAG: 30S ribosomal protein S3ae [Thermoprotei archaeon]|nr:MAG: 30S ribosomal protein S3ae [Thermoprotei archaeon]
MSSRAAREARSRWEAKRWFVILAPSAFGFAELGAAPASDEKSMLGRTIEVSFYDITKDISQLPIKLKFQIVKIEGHVAYTQLKQIELTRDYIRSLVRRGTSRIDAIMDVITKDGVELRVMCMAVTQSRVKTSQKKAIRRIMFEIIEEKSSALTFEEFVQEAVLGRIAAEIEMRAKKIYPLRKAEVRKIKVLSSVFEIPLRVPPLQASTET